MDLSGTWPPPLSGPALEHGRAQDTARYAIDGRAPRFAVRPATRDEVVEVVRACDADGLALVPWGGGVALAREAAPQRYDVALDLAGLDRIVEFEPDDFTVTAECGVTLADLRAALAECGEELPLEAPEAWGATLGGVLAASASGARRLRFGGPRDRLLGARFVTGDGVLARSGGRVVKNVAGHAIHRLLCGSRGGLAVLLEASLKLLPLPPSRQAFVHGADAAAIADTGRWSVFPRREPAALTVIGRAIASRNPVLAMPEPFTVVTGFEDDATWVEACAQFTRERLGAAKLSVRDASVPPLWQALADAEEMPGPRLTFATAHNTPAALAPLAHRALAERLVFHAPCGRLHVWPAPEEAGALVRELAALGFALIDARGIEVEAPAPPRSIAALRGRVRAALDPHGVLAYGERWARGS